MSRLPLSLIVISAAGCGQGDSRASRVSDPARKEVSPPEAQRFVGRVVLGDGQPSPNTVIVLSDPVRGNMVATAVSTGDGSFVTSASPGRYALTATSPQQSAYLPAVQESNGNLEIRLSANCHVVSGRIRANVPIPRNAIIRLGRLSNVVGDAFGALVANDGTFGACLPEATYIVFPPDGFVERPSAVIVPDTRTFDYRTHTTEAANAAPLSMDGIEPEKSDEFVASVPATVRLLALGETNHGTAEFYDERALLVTKLARQGFRLMMIEAGYGEVLALNDYVAGTASNVEAAVQALGYWTWDTYTFIATLKAIRKYNSSASREQRIQIVGFDVQNTASAIDLLLKKPMLKERMSPEATRSLRELTKEKGGMWPKLSDSERSAVRAVLKNVSSIGGVGGLGAESNRLAMAAKSLLYRFEMLDQTDSYRRSLARDVGMAEMVFEVMALEPNTRATLWAHIGHLDREDVVGQATMGSHIAAKLADAYRVYGLFAFEGKVRAWDTESKVGVVVRDLPVAPKFSVESVLHEKSRDRPVTYWTFSKARGTAAVWLQGVHPYRSFGAVFPKPEYEFLYGDLNAIDGAILFSAVTPTLPTPTGERRAN